MNSLLFYNMLNFVFFLHMKSRPILQLVTLQVQYNIVMASLVAAPCDTTFTIQVGGKCLFVSLKKSWLILLSERK